MKIKRSTWSQVHEGFGVWIDMGNQSANPHAFIALFWMTVASRPHSIMLN